MSDPPSADQDVMRWAKQYQELGTGPVSTRPYTSPDYLADEVDYILRRTWLNVGTAEDLPDAGSFRVLDLGALNLSVILVRGMDSEIRAFHNVCRHRASRLVREVSGRAPNFSCGYHGWVYDTAGTLVRVPGEEQFEGLNKADCGLKEIPCELRSGFIFINCAEQPDETLAETLGEMAETFETYPFDELKKIVTYTAEVNANWKVSMDIAKEPYHFAFVHRKSIPDSHIGAGDELAFFPAIRLFKRNRSATIAANPSHNLRPSEEIAYEQMSTILQGGEAAPKLAPCLNPDRVKNWAFDVHVLFPNCAVLLGAGWMVVHRFLPLAIDRTRWETTMHMTPARNAGEVISQEFSKILTRDLLREDLATVQNNQSGLQSSAVSEIWLGDEEIMLRHGADVIERLLQERRGPNNS